jgi:phage tail-like protein
VANEQYPFTAFNFHVELDVADAATLPLGSPLVDAEFAECDGLEMTMEPKTVREGGNNSRQIQLIGPVSFGNLTLKRGMTSRLDLWQWFALSSGNATPGRGAKADGVVMMRDGTGTPTVRFRVFGCLPIKLKAPMFNAKEGQIAIEEMQIAYESFSVELA